MAKRACPICRDNGIRTEWILERHTEMDTSRVYDRDEWEITEEVCSVHSAIRNVVDRRIIRRG